MFWPPTVCPITTRPLASDRPAAPVSPAGRSKVLDERQTVWTNVSSFWSSTGPSSLRTRLWRLLPLCITTAYKPSTDACIDAKMGSLRALRNLAPRTARFSSSPSPSASASYFARSARSLHTQHFGRAREAPSHLSNKYPVIVSLASAHVSNSWPSLTHPRTMNSTPSSLGPAVLVCGRRLVSPRPDSTRPASRSSFQPAATRSRRRAASTPRWATCTRTTGDGTCTTRSRAPTGWATRTRSTT